MPWLADPDCITLRTHAHAQTKGETIVSDVRRHILGHRLTQTNRAHNFVVETRRHS